MSEELHLEIQACIHQFYDTLKNAPQTLDESLKELNLANLDVFFIWDEFRWRECS